MDEDPKQEYEHKIIIETEKEPDELEKMVVNIPVNDEKSLQDEERKTSERKQNVCLRKCCHHFKICQRRYHQLPQNPGKWQKFKYSLLCPPAGILNILIIYVILILFLWVISFVFFGKQAEPQGILFSILFLVVGCLIAGWLVSLIKLPPLVGMLLVGLAIKNIPYINIAMYIEIEWSSKLRNLALCVILIRAGLSLDLDILLRLKWILLKLAFFPSLLEAVVIAILSHFLTNFPWQWAFLLGFVLAAVSPSVIVPGMLLLEKKGYGVNKGIPTLIIAAASLNNVIIISCFYIILGIIFSTGNLIYDIGRGPLELVTGVLYGCILGCFCWFIPNKNEKNVVFYRCSFLLFGGITALFGSKSLNLAGAGAIGCLVLAFVASYGWRKQTWKKINPVSEFMTKIWIIFQPILFGLIGAEIDVSKLDGNTIGLGVAIILVGFVIRFIITLLSVKSSWLSIKETIFISLSWLAKATVQAAIGPIALDLARKKNENMEEINLGIQVLSIAVVTILIAAPLGATLIVLTAPKLLLQNLEFDVEIKQKPTYTSIV